jgi:hypothetical protein
MPALLALVPEALALLLVPLLVLLLLLLLLLLLHAAMANAELTAMTAARVLLIRASFLAGARKCRAVEPQLGRDSTKGY